MDRNDVVAIALLTDSDVARLGNMLRAVYRADDAANFDALLDAIDTADREVHQRLIERAR